MISPDAIRNEQGQVLMVWTLNRPPKQVVIDGTDRVYIFTYNFNVCASWVNEEDVTRMLAVREKTCNCNNGNYRQAFDYANRLNANLFLYGNREGKVYKKENV